MSERYVLPEQLAAEREFTPAQAWWKFAPRFNVAPGQFVPAIRLHGGKSEAVTMRWGLIPAWAQGRPGVEPPASVAVEQIERSPLHRQPWHDSQRCILPAAGFYAWRLTSRRYRQPYFVSLVDRAAFGFAALWDCSEAQDGDVVESCSVIRVPANELLRKIANTDRRMPVILRRRDYDTWLRGTPSDARRALRAYAAVGMQAHCVSPRINSSLPDDADLIAPTSRVIMMALPRAAQKPRASTRP